MVHPILCAGLLFVSGDQSLDVRWRATTNATCSAPWWGGSRNTCRSSPASGPAADVAAFYVAALLTRRKRAGTAMSRFRNSHFQLPNPPLRTIWLEARQRLGAATFHQLMRPAHLSKLEIGRGVEPQGWPRRVQNSRLDSTEHVT